LLHLESKRALSIDQFTVVHQENQFSSVSLPGNHSNEEYTNV